MRNYLPAFAGYLFGLTVIRRMRKRAARKAFVCWELGYRAGWEAGAEFGQGFKPDSEVAPKSA